MEYVETVLNDFSAQTIIDIFILMLALTGIWQIVNKFITTFGIQFKWIESYKSRKKLLQKHDTMINEMTTEVHAINDKVNVLGQMMVDMQSKADATERARIKDIIAKSYRYYHEKQRWSKMEKESFTDLIRNYESHGGSNSFVHTVCEPESQTWEVYDE